MNPYSKTFKIFVLAILSFSLMPGILTGCGRQSNEPVSLSGFYFDTVITVTLYDEEQSGLLDECMNLADRYEKLLSKTVEGSDVWRINHAGTEPVTVDQETAALLSLAIRYAKLTDGLVDPSVGVLSSLWDFSASSDKRIPSAADIRAALPHLNYENILLEGTTVTLTDPQLCIDLGFIAKGFIADRMKAYLVAAGAKHGLINLGGNVLTIGGRPDGAAFRVGIQEPFAPGGTALTTLPVSDGSVVTSGIYERYFRLDGRLYHHILNTKTGYPVENNLLSVTILSKSSADGDALSTSCLALGLTDGMALIESLPDTEALFVTEDNVLHPTSGLTLDD